jgi:hypothetical protein
MGAGKIGFSIVAAYIKTVAIGAAEAACAASQNVAGVF